MLSFSKLRADWPVLSTTIFTTTFWLIIFFVCGLAGWPGKKDNCFENYLTQKNCYCEKPREGALFVQPANSLSNMMFCVVALFIAYTADTKQFPSPTWWQSHDNLITHHVWFPIAFTSITTFLGPGSMMMHASFTLWGGKLDVISMFLYVGFAALLALTKFSLSIVGWKDTSMSQATRWNAGIYIVLMVILVGVYAFTSLDGLILFQVFLYTAIGMEFIVRLYERCYRKLRTAKTWLYFLSLVLFGGAYGIWVPSQSGGPLCFPESVFQGHAVWHVLSALSIGVSFYYHLSDHTIDRQGSGAKYHDAGEDALHSQGVVGGSQAVTQEMDESNV